MITSVTLNPAVDEAIAVEEIALGEINRCDLDAVDPGGKGLNASRVIARLGRRTRAFGFVAGVTGELIRARLDAEGVPHAFDDVPGLTRINVMVLERRHARRTRLYLPGPHVGAADVARLRTRLETCASGETVIIGGSVPPGLDAGVYGDLVRWLRGRGVRTVVDASGAALESALAAQPDLIKPNVEEAVALLGRPLASDDEVCDAARSLRALGAARVVISQGAHGAIGVDEAGAWKVRAPAVLVRTTVGAGDSMVAGLAIA
ncbi:MAG TPA: 1-phosphofructokinase family hexose kinase, partial [Candidatus Limnocylindria bacterium]|nr:1-phosphofructokinase family hexose kinase [Candidatus Limnocylindria bacterium]